MKLSNSCVGYAREANVLRAPLAALEETEQRFGPSEIAGEQHDWIIVNARAVA